MDKRYQVFVSSTYQDLAEERKEIIQALLELDCIPSGMELFPAANEDQWTLIKRVIDDCDYYIVVISGKYGSIGPDGFSYTEMEYRYALDAKKPIIAFVHKDIRKLPLERVETDPALAEKLQKFTELAKKKLIRFWESPPELGSVVSRSIVQLIKNHPAIGWVRADNLPDEPAAQEILRLTKDLEKLRSEREVAQRIAPSSAERLSQGEDKVKLDFDVRYRKNDAVTWSTELALWHTSLTWNQMLAVVAPSMIHEANKKVIKSKLDELAFDQGIDKIQNHDFFEQADIRGVTLSEKSYDTFLVQMVALGVFEKSTKPRSVKDTDTYWRLTPYGEKLMYELRAIREDSGQADDLPEVSLEEPI